MQENKRRSVRIGVAVAGIMLVVIALVGVWSRYFHAPLPLILRSSHPSILLITIDTLRPDRLSAYGYDKQRTPAFDALAAGGVLFENAVCDIPWTTGSMASVMTGTFSAGHGLHFPNERLASSHHTLAEMLRERGYDTAAIVGSFPVASLYGLNQGFDTYDEEFSQAVLRGPGLRAGEVNKIPTPSTDDATAFAHWADDKLRNDAYRTDDEVSDRAIQWIEKRPQASFFLWVHYFGPHERLYNDKPLIDQEPRMVAEYDTDLATTDAALSRLMAAVQRIEAERNVLVILHADHGQSLGEHDFVGHGIDLHDASVRIPLIIRYPGWIRPGGRIRTLVRNVDILPTILDFLGMPIPSDRNGRSLTRIIEEQGGPEVPAYIETYATQIALRPVSVPDLGSVIGPMIRQAIRTERWKLTRSKWSSPCTKGTAAHRSRRFWGVRWELENPVDLVPEQCDQLQVLELYDTAADPGETNNVAQAHPDLVEQLRTRLDAAAQQKGAAETIKLSPAEKERLRSLGYEPGND